MKNKEIKDVIKQANLYQWQIAEALDISEYTLCRKLRKELTDQQRREIYQAIEALKDVEK